MNKHDLGLVIEAINQIHDNLWLGDLETAREIAVKNLARIQEEAGFLDIIQTATDTRKKIRQLQKDAREKGVRNRRLWVADRLSKKLGEEFDPTKNIYGVLAIRLNRLKEAILYLAETRTQRTIKGLADENFEREPILQRKERSRYAIQRLPDRWEVRAILDTPVHSWDLRRLRQRLPEFNVSIEEGISGFLKIYSRDMYIQVLKQQSLAEIQIHTPKTKDAKQRVSKIIETIVDCLNP